MFKEERDRDPSKSDTLRIKCLNLIYFREILDGNKLGELGLYIRLHFLPSVSVILNIDIRFTTVRQSISGTSLLTQVCISKENRN